MTVTKAFVIIGLLLIVLASIAIGIRRHWLTTIKLTPVDMPVSMAIGHISTGDFKIDINYSYKMALDFDRDSYPDQTLACLTGIETHHEECAGMPSLVDVRWVVTSDGKVVEEGTTDDQGGGYWGDHLGRELGLFNARAGQHYKVDLEFLQDGSRLAAAHPRLIIFPGPEFGGELGATYLYVELLAVICAGVGALLILVSFLLHKARVQEAKWAMESAQE